MTRTATVRFNGTGRAGLRWRPDPGGVLPDRPGHGAQVASVLARVPGGRGLATILSARTADPANVPEVRRVLARSSPAERGDAMISATRCDGRPLSPRLTMPLLSLRARRRPLTGAGRQMPVDAVNVVMPPLTRFLEDNQ